MQLLRGRTHGVNWLVVSPDSRYVAAGGGRCHLWDLAAAELKARTPDNPGDFATGMTFPAPAVFTTWGGNQLRRYDLNAGTDRVYSLPRVDSFRGAIVHPSGDSMKAWGPSGGVIVNVTITADGLETVESERLPTSPVLVAFSPDGNRYLCRDSDPADPRRRYHLRDHVTDEVVATFEEPESMHSEYYWTHQWLFTPDSRRLIALNRHVAAYDCASGGLPVAEYLATSVGKASAMAAHPDGRRVATVEDHRTVTLRDADSFAPLRSYDFAMATCVAFTQDGTRCVLGNSRGKVLLFDLE